MVGEKILAKTSKKKKKKRKIMMQKVKIISIFVLIILATILLFCNVQGNQKQTKEMEIVSRYMSYINESKYAEMYAMLSDASKKSITETDFIEKHQMIYEQLEASNVQTSNMKEEEENRENQSYIYNKYGNLSWKSNICKYYETYKRR